MIPLREFTVDIPKTYSLGTWVDYNTAVDLYNYKGTEALMYSHIFQGRYGFKSINGTSMIDMGVVDKRKFDFIVQVAQHNFMFINQFLKNGEIGELFSHIYSNTANSWAVFGKKQLFETRTNTNLGVLTPRFAYTTTRLLLDKTFTNKMINYFVNRLEDEFCDEGFANYVERNRELVGYINGTPRKKKDITPLIGLIPLDTALIRSNTRTDVAFELIEATYKGLLDEYGSTSEMCDMQVLAS